MRRLADVTADRLELMDLQARQQVCGYDLSDPDFARGLVFAGPCWCVEINDWPVAAGGLIIVGRSIPLAWSLLDQSAGRHMLTITLLARRFLRAFGEPVEAAIEADFMAAQRWAAALGFVYAEPWGIPPTDADARIDRWVWHGA